MISIPYACVSRRSGCSLLRGQKIQGRRVAPAPAGYMAVKDRLKIPHEHIDDIKKVIVKKINNINYMNKIK